MKKSFTLASAISLTGAVAMVVGSMTACGDDDPAPNNSSSGSTGGVDSGTEQDTGSNGTSGGTSGTTSGGLVDPDTVPGVVIPYGKCETFTKCGGDLEGTWTITGGCLPDTTFNQFKAVCPLVREYDVIIKASGDITATATTLSQTTKIFLSAKIDVPEACASAVPGGSCDTIPTLLTAGFGGTKFDHAQCTREGTGASAICKCAADTQIEEDPAPNEYTEDTGTVTTKTPVRTYEYCNQNGSTSYREVTKDNKSFSMVLKVGPKT